MISFEDALRIALESARPLEAVQVPLDRAAGSVLAEDVLAASDLPPFDRAAMDGYAVRASDLASADAELRLVGEVAAGDQPRRTLGRGECVRIFTGAVVPPGADAVAMQENARVVEPAGPAGQCLVRFSAPVRPGENIARRGEDVRAGELVLERGRLVDAAAIALAAAAGRGELSVVRRPRASVLSTGDELVPADASPGPSETRDANGPALVARLRAAGFEVSFLGIARDDRRELAERLGRGLESDCLVVTGGVSVGDRDLVPEVMRELGAETLFAGVAIKPGKPTKLARRGRTAVWGLPGNPVSALVVAELLVLPALRNMAGRPDPALRPLRGVLASAVRKKPSRRLFTPALAEWRGAAIAVEPLESHGSADLVAHSRANALLTLPEDSSGAAAGEEVELYPLEAFRSEVWPCGGPA